MQVDATPEWRQVFPDAHVGILVMHGLGHTARHPALGARLDQLQADLRQRYAAADRASLAALPTAQAYQAHYRPFGQTYHVLRQLESVVFTGRDLASPAGVLVSAMFGAELNSLLLTAGHDLAEVRLPLVVDVSRPGDRFVGINGQEREVRPGDMLMRDRAGIISAVLYGPDQRTRLSETTAAPMFVTYAPAGITAAAVRAHLTELSELVRVAEPDARVAELRLI